MAHPIRPDNYIEINNFYTATVYEKGAEVVRMIHTLLGADRFRKGSDLYFDRHDGQAVTTEDFVKAMEDANGIDLGQFRHWYSQAGTPTLKVTGEYDEAEKAYRLNVAQSCPSTPDQDKKEPFHLPLAVGLLGADGKDMAIEMSGDEVSSVRQQGDEFTLVLNVTEGEQTFTFPNVPEKPVPSLLRGFSAPVKLEDDYTRDDLMFLMSNDADGFNRWEAGQRLAVSVIHEVMGQVQDGKQISVDRRLTDAYQNVLNEALERDNDKDFDKSMVAEMMVLPAEGYLAELQKIADVDAIHRAREAVRDAIAMELKGLLIAVYKMNKSDAEFAPTTIQMAQRAIKNISLSYLMQPEATEMVNLCVQQFEGANNMTDSGAALQCIVNSPAAKGARDKALTDFYNRWVNEALVIDMWFQLQAGSKLPDTLERVNALMEHEAFTLKNPNRARALIGPFSRNMVSFHQASGEGYRFLADRVLELNGLNPQIAARIMGPLTRWRRFDETRQRLMKGELERILSSDDLSPDVYEIASKSV
jgi:aminopeptidase N